MTINIQWSSIFFDRTNYWQPNYFVSLVDKVETNYKFNISSRGITLIDSDGNYSDDFVNDGSDKKKFVSKVKQNILQKLLILKNKLKLVKLHNIFQVMMLMKMILSLMLIIRKLIVIIVQQKITQKTAHGHKHNNTSNNIEQPDSIKDTINNEIENNLDNVFIKPFREFKRNKDIYQIISNSDEVLGKIPNIIKSNIQVVVDMKNY